jgi:MFS family permease
MTTLDPDPFTVSLVQVATSLPMLIFVIPAGALADIVDRRRLLIATQLTVVVLAAGFGLSVEVLENVKTTLQGLDSRDVVSSHRMDQFADTN